MQPRGVPPGAVVFFLAVFFASGVAALVDQTIWQRLLTLVLGTDVTSATIVVSAFMVGLGAGHLAGGHLADRLDARARLWAFAACELTVAVFTAWSATLYYDELQTRLTRLLLPRAIEGVVVFLVTLWPTFFMGMTLPLATRVITRDIHAPARWVPVLYGWNTLGGACGALLTVALLFRAFDVVTSLRLSAGLSAAAGLAVVAAGPFLQRLGRQSPAAPAADLPPARAAQDRFVGFRTWMAMAALSGFVALSLELLWFRILGVVLKSNAVTFGYLLTFYLGGLGIGALLATRTRVRAWPAASSFFLVQSAIPVCSAVAVVAFAGLAELEPFARYLRNYDRTFVEAVGWHSLPQVVVPLLMIGPPTVMMGLAFGCLQRAVQTDLAWLGRRLGRLQAANIAGSAVGAAATGVVFLDRLGTPATLQLVVCCSIPSAWMYFRMRQDRPRGAYRAAAVLSVALAAWAVPSGGVFWARLHGSAPADIIYAEDSTGLQVLRREAGTGTVIVCVNGLSQSWLPYGGIHTVLGALPALMHPSPAAVAVVGLGSGDTLSAVGGRPETRVIENLELVAADIATLRILDRARRFPALQLLLSDPRIRFRVADGRTYLRRSAQRYDIIEADALRPISAYAGYLYSVEYFELLRDRLAPGGLAAMWTPTWRTRASLIAAFPYVLQFDDIAVASARPIAFDPQVVRARMHDPGIRQYYQLRGIDLDRLLADYLAAPPAAYGPGFNRAALTDVNRDLFPKDEFGVPDLPALPDR